MKTLKVKKQKIVTVILSLLVIFMEAVQLNTINVKADEFGTDWYPREAMYDKTLDDKILTLVSQVFDPVAYAWYNPDLLESGYTTDAQLFDHWKNTGIYEGRRSSLVFDINYFMANNPELTIDYIKSHMDQAFQFCSDYLGLYTANEIKSILSYNPNSSSKTYYYTIFAILKNSNNFETVAEYKNYLKNGVGNCKNYNWNCSFKLTAKDFPPRKSTNARWVAINNYYHTQEINKSNYQWGMMKEGMLTWEEIYIEHRVNLNPIVHLSTDVAAKSKHVYYGKNITASQRQQADAYCYSIAQYVLTDPQFANLTDLERIDVAARIVANRCSQITYVQDGNKFYKSPYGVGVAGVYTCAGSARTMGRVLEYMGIEWAHVNENDNCHQWCVFYLDGVLCCADGMAGFATYGNGVSYPCTLDGTTIWPATWRVVYSFK